MIKVRKLCLLHLHNYNNNNNNNKNNNKKKLLINFLLLYLTKNIKGLLCCRKEKQ